MKKVETSLINLKENYNKNGPLGFYMLNIETYSEPI